MHYYQSDDEVHVFHGVEDRAKEWDCLLIYDEDSKVYHIRLTPCSMFAQDDMDRCLLSRSLIPQYASNTTRNSRGHSYRPGRVRASFLVIAVDF